MSSEHYLCLIIATLISCLTVSYFMLHEDEGFRRIHARVNEIQKDICLGASWFSVIALLMGIILYQGYYYLGGTLFFFMVLYRVFYYCGKKKKTKK